MPAAPTQCVGAAAHRGWRSRLTPPPADYTRGAIETVHVPPGECEHAVNGRPTPARPEWPATRQDPDARPPVPKLKGRRVAQGW